MTIDFITELTVLGLLIATCGYCIVLSRRLRALRDGQTELIALIEKFDESSRRAEKNLATLQANSAIMGRKLGSLTQRAAGLTDELSVMVQAGDNIANRIEVAVDEARSSRNAIQTGGRAA